MYTISAYVYIICRCQCHLMSKYVMFLDITLFIYPSYLPQILPLRMHKAIQTVQIYFPKKFNIFCLRSRSTGKEFFQHDHSNLLLVALFFLFLWILILSVFFSSRKKYYKNNVMRKKEETFSSKQYDKKRVKKLNWTWLYLVKQWTVSHNISGWIKCDSPKLNQDVAIEVPATRI